MIPPEKTTGCPFQATEASVTMTFGGCSWWARMTGCCCCWKAMVGSSGGWYGSVLMTATGAPAKEEDTAAVLATGSLRTPLLCSRGWKPQVTN